MVEFVMTDHAIDNMIAGTNMYGQANDHRYVPILQITYGRAEMRALVAVLLIHGVTKKKGPLPALWANDVFRGYALISRAISRTRFENIYRLLLLLS